MKDAPEYLYLMKERPPGPGSQPRKGLLWAQGDGMDRNGRHYWGIAAYERELTEEETEHYAMELMDRTWFEGQ